MDSNTTAALEMRVRKLVAGALQVSAEEVTPELAFGDLPQWDSLGHMEVMLQLEEQFGVGMDTDLIANLTSIPAILAHLQEQGQ